MRDRLVVHLPCREQRECGAGRQRETQIGQLAPAHALCNPHPHQHGGRRGDQRHMRALQIWNEAGDFHEHGERPPQRTPDQQTRRQHVQIEARKAETLLAGIGLAQPPGPDHRGERQQRGRPEAAVCQRTQAFGIDVAEQRWSDRHQERHTADHLQRQTEVETQTLLERHRQPQNQQTAHTPHRTRRAPWQHEEHGQIDEHQSDQQHDIHTRDQRPVLLHLRIAQGKHHAANHQHTDQRCGHEPLPARGQYAALPLAHVHVQEEHQPTQNLDGERAEQKAARVQAQAHIQRHHTGHGPGDGGVVHPEQQRRDQVEKAQADHRQNGQPQRLEARQLLTRRAAQLHEAEEQRRPHHQCTEWRAFQQGLRTRSQFHKQRKGRSRLQTQREQARHAPLLAQPQPIDARTFDGPGRRGPTRIERERNRQRTEDHAKRQIHLHQQRGAIRRRPAFDEHRQPHVEQPQHQRAECHAEFDVLNQRALQTKADDGRAEQHRRVDIVRLLGRPAQQRLTLLGRRAGIAQLAPREQQADADIHQEQHDQKRLGAVEQLRLVRLHAPREADAEGGEEAHQIQQAPGLEPRNREDAGIQQNEIAEQRDMVAAAGRRQNRRGEPAQHRGHRETHRVLQHGQHRQTDRHHNQQRERRTGRDQRMQSHRREDREVENRDTRALQHQAIGRAFLSQSPAQNQQHDRRQRDARVAQLHRHRDALGRIAQQERQTDEQQHHADAQHRVAAEQPILGGADGALDKGGAARFADVGIDFGCRRANELGVDTRGGRCGSC